MYFWTILLQVDKELCCHPATFILIQADLSSFPLGWEYFKESIYTTCLSR